MSEAGRCEKALLIGLDSAVPGRWRRYAEEGALPVARRLLAAGAFAAECLPAFPTLTTTNWATIATGALPGTHGITDFNPHRPGDLVGDSPQGFDARDVTAEFVWETVVRSGRDSIVVNWPGSWPPREAPGASGLGATSRTDDPAPGVLTLVGGAGIELNEWRIGLPGMERRVALAAEQRFSTRPEPGATLVTLPAPGEPFELRLGFRDAYDEVRSKVALSCRVVRRDGRDVLRVQRRGDEEVLAELLPGGWSARLELPVSVKGGGTVHGLFRLRLQELDATAGLLRLYVSDICRRSWLEQPAGVLGGGGFAGLPTPGVGWDSLGAGCIDLETFVDLTGMATTWLSDVCVRLLLERPWDVFCVHFHAIDSFYHLCSRKLDEAQTAAAEVRRYEAAERAVYRQLDDALGCILEAAGGSALTVLVSDHGAKPGGARVPLRRLLADAGLLAEQCGGAGEGRTDIDWTRTFASPQGSCFVRVNLAGRDPRGVVSAADYEGVRQRAIRAMLEYRDPDSGACPFSLVVPAEEAVTLGLFGDGVGDVVYAILEDFADEHGQVLPQDIREDGDWGMRSLCLFAGPGITPGSVIAEPFSLIDVAPTVCAALGISPPLQADGRSLLRLLSGPARRESFRHDL